MLYLWSCNQSVACKCRNWNMPRPNILDNKSMEPCKIQEFWELQICIDVTVLLHCIWELLSNTLFAFTFDIHFFRFLPLSSSFFHFLLEETGRNTFFPVSSILPGRNLFLPEVSEPWRGVRAIALGSSSRVIVIHFGQSFLLLSLHCSTTDTNYKYFLYWSYQKALQKLFLRTLRRAF